MALPRRGKSDVWGEVWGHEENRTKREKNYLETIRIGFSFSGYRSKKEYEMGSGGREREKGNSCVEEEQRKLKRRNLLHNFFNVLLALAGIVFFVWCSFCSIQQGVSLVVSVGDFIFSGSATRRGEVVSCQGCFGNKLKQVSSDKAWVGAYFLCSGFLFGVVHWLGDNSCRGVSVLFKLSNCGRKKSKTSEIEIAEK